MKNNLKTPIILFKAHQSLIENVKYSLIGSNLNMNEFTAMEALYVKGELTTQALIDTVLIPNSSMTYVLELLDNKDFIEKTKNKDDKRVQMLKLSQQGITLFENIYEKHFDHMRNVFDVLSLEEEKQLQDILKKLGEKAEGALV